MTHSLVVVDDHAGLPSVPSTEVLTAARGLGGAVDAVWLGAAAPGPEALDVLGSYGARTVYVPELGGLTPDVAAVAAEAVLAVVGQADGPDAVLLVSTFAGKEIAARLAVGLGSGAVVDAVGVERADDGSLAARKVVFAGTWESVCTVTRGVPVVALKPASVEARPVTEAVAPAVVDVPVAFSPAARGVRVVERTEHAGGGRVPLSEAKVVVAGGRGVEGDFSAVEELADLLGAAVGATRVATDEGWIGHHAQIGQTGVTIAPRVYIGVGVSGAVHHTAGMQAAETIIAVNTDPEAPIFEMADFGVVGDVADVLPQAIAELRRLRQG
ncbi:electron transfer flavoprotein subunit alpha/FixB family protein [Georgenia faecalis]|uniref:electron transfer flavoprotein subunit alpha/FixB family protein n=1 Tax=Georgenia faecalis TaxID=2483799 RepID=UPI000FD7904B|nr:electron transfer flavoprotein subunit alpha/FixB family protein [Georgenia faecalis]